MKRDMDLVREILIELEGCPANGKYQTIDIAGRTSEEVSYHVMLMYEAGLIHAHSRGGIGLPLWKPIGLTFEGHEFLDASRSSKLWKAAKDWSLNSVGALTLDALKAAFPIVTRQLME